MPLSSIIKSWSILLCASSANPIHGVWRLLRLLDASCCSGIALRLLQGLELGLLFWRELFRLPCFAEFLGQLPLCEATPGVLLRVAAEVAQLLQELLGLPTHRGSLQVVQLFLLLPSEASWFPCLGGPRIQLFSCVEVLRYEGTCPSTMIVSTSSCIAG